jgi:hypothetical protein
MFKKMKTRYSILLITVLFFLSCGENKKAKDFAFTKDIFFEEMNVEDKLGYVAEMRSTKDYLIVAGKNLKSEAALIDKTTKESYAFVQFGEGPHELLSAHNIILVGNTVCIYDFAKCKLLAYDIDSIVRSGLQYKPEVIFKNIQSRPMELNQIDSRTYVATGLLSGIKNKIRLVGLNPNGDIISEGGTLPEKQDNVSDIVHVIAYQSMLTANEKLKRTAVCTRYAGMMQVYEYCDTIMNLINENILFLADYEERNGNFAPTTQTKWGYLSIDSDDKYIYAVFSGSVQIDGTPFFTGSEIHVYDWEGEPVGILKTDRKLIQMCTDGNNIYAYDSDKGDIVVASLAGVFK